MFQNEFSITLPSNSSMKFFPDNTTTNFSTQLPKEIELNGKWEVGISEIHVPCSVLHLRVEDAKITIHGQDSVGSNCIQHGAYTSIEHIVETVNSTWEKYFNDTVCLKLFYDSKGGYVSIGYETAESHRKCKHMILEPRLKRILGCEEGFDLLEYKPIIDNYMLYYTAKHPASLARAIPDQLFIYSNICEPSIVGDTFAPLLRIVNIDAKQYNFGSTIVKKYTPITYVPLLNTRFHTIDIDIRDQFGKPIAFEFGTLTVVLHFRKVFF